MLHFGKLDQHIPKESVDAVQTANPDVPVFWYDAGHGFNCNDPASYNAMRRSWRRAFARVSEEAFWGRFSGDLSCLRKPLRRSVALPEADAFHPDG